MASEAIAHALENDERPSDVAPISGTRISLAPRSSRGSVLPLSRALVLTDLLLGASYADGTFCSSEQAVVRETLCRLLRAEDLPLEVHARIDGFDPQSFDATAAAKLLTDTSKVGKRALMEMIGEICGADGRVELDENSYMLAIAIALAMAQEDYRDIATENAIRGKWLTVKRAEDLLLGAIALACAALPMAVIALLVKLTSKGPVFFAQKRYGEGGKIFEVLKFRTMTTTETGENGAAVTQATKNDSRITRFGAFLRRTSLDELPQIFNVLKGEMSLVGPRPHAVAHNEMYRRLILRYMLRHQVKPGITGFAQVNGWRGETDTLEKMTKRVEYDLHYVQHWTPKLDLQILFFTIFGKKVRKNAY